MINVTLRKAMENYYKPKLITDRIGSCGGRWAESVHLDFSKDGFYRSKWNQVKKNGWMIENTVIVHKSVRTTFFQTIGFHGGYAGIQQHEQDTCGTSEGN